MPYRNRGMGLIALAPGGGLGRRLWPAPSFARLAACLVERTNAVILLMGGPGEEGIAEQVISASGGHLARVLNVVGKVSLGEAAALLGGCDLFIGNDSGPMHMAAAMGVPCVEISCHPAGGDPLGENSAARFAPWGVPSRVLQPRHAIAPCRTACTKPYAHCIASISSDEVLDAAWELLAGPDVRLTNRTEVGRGPMSAV